MVLTIGIIYFLYVLFKVYISVMEIGYVAKAKDQTAVILKPSSYFKAANYKISKERIEIISALVEYILFIFWMGFGLHFLEELIKIENMALKTVIFIDIFIAVNYIVMLPFTIYEKFVLDKKYGFSNMSVKLFIVDQIKAAVLFLIFGSLIIWAIAKIMLNFSNWWIFGFLFIFAVIIFINMIYPTLIAPIFNKFTVLEDEELRDSIEDLMRKSGLKSEGVYTIDASKRDNRLNAYFGGLGKSKRVVLFDTLLKKLDKKELLAVLGHELGHYKHKDILKNIFMMGMMLFVMFAIFGNLPKSVFDAFHLQNGSPYGIIAIFLLLSPIITFLMLPLMGLVSRKAEYEADEYGGESVSKRDLATALMKLAEENKSFPRSHPLYIFFYFTHPPLLERLKRLGYDFTNEEEAIEKSWEIK